MGNLSNISVRWRIACTDQQEAPSPETSLRSIFLLAGVPLLQKDRVQTMWVLYCYSIGLAGLCCASACCFSRLAKEPLEFIPKQFVDRAKDGPTAVVYFLHVFVGNEKSHSTGTKEQFCF